MHPTHRLLLLQLVAFWPVWRWYLARLTDASDEPLGLLALATVGVVVALQGRPQTLHPRQLCTAALLTGLYLGTWAWGPPLLRASIAVMAIGYTLGAGYWRQALHPGVLGLLWLALPLAASLQFYVGYPLRLLTAQLAAHIIGLTGFAVTAQGTCLLWQGEVIVVDAPCAGIRMLWAGIYLSCTLSCVTRLRPGPTGLAAVLAMMILFLGNVGRNVLLFYGEAGIVHFAAWMHTGIGLGVFTGVAMAIVAMQGSIKRWTTQVILPANTARATLLPQAAWFLRPALAIWLLVHGAAAVLPLLAVSAAERPHHDAAPHWPVQLAGRPLYPLALTAQEHAFTQDFPGHVARFTDGSREIVIRWVQHASRRLHPASDCFQGMGYRVHPQPLRMDSEGAYWGCFQATRSDKRWQVCERITDSQGHGWSDVSSWYWAAILGRSTGPWWTFTVAEDGF